ncbi:MAG: hypothetical protein ABIP75_06435 [Pyrinomonadaceae bacterium]
MNTMAFFFIDQDTSLLIIMAIVAVCFVVIAFAMIAIALVVARVGKTAMRLEKKVEPLLARVNALTDQSQAILVQGKEIAEQFNAMSGHLTRATLYFSESAALIKEEVAELKELVGDTAVTARDKVAMVSRTIDDTNQQVVSTTEFINDKVVQPAREIAAIMAGVRRGLEVLFAPQPKSVDQIYGEEEMFIG